MALPFFRVVSIIFDKICKDEPDQCFGTLEKCISCRASQNVGHCLKMWNKGMRNKNAVEIHIKTDVWTRNYWEKVDSFLSAIILF